MRKASFQSGFTIFEMLVVLSIITILSVLLITNFRTIGRGPMPRHQLTSIVVSEIRKAQSITLAGMEYNGSSVCGFGIHPDLTVNKYFIYARPPKVFDDICDTTVNRNYDSSTDSIIEEKNFTGSNLRVTWASDIYFELPFAKTYINNSNDPSASVIIDINQIDSPGSCPGTNCSRITVFSSGRIDVQN